MLRTHPIPLSFLTHPSNFVYGARVQGLLKLPFSPNVLKKRVMRTSRKGDKGEAAYYVDMRDVADRCDAVVGPENWDVQFPIISSAGMRVMVVANFRIGRVIKAGESEEMFNYRVRVPVIETVETNDEDGNKIRYQRERKEDGKTVLIEGEKPNELAVLRAGPNASKRAAVLHGIGAYLYNFKDINTWERINEYRQFVNPEVDIKDLPDFAIPPSGPVTVLRELGYLFNIDIPNNIKDLDKDIAKRLSVYLNDYWGMDSLKDQDITEREYYQLAGCIARCSDYLEANENVSFQDLVKKTGKKMQGLGFGNE